MEILGQVLNREPDISQAPVRVQPLLRWCLEKERKDRLAAIGDARRLLAEDAGESSVTTPRRHRRSGSGRLRGRLRR